MSKIVFGTGFKDSGQTINALSGGLGLDFKEVNKIVITNINKIKEIYTKKTEHGKDISTTHYLKKNEKQGIDTRVLFGEITANQTNPTYRIEEINEIKMGERDTICFMVGVGGVLLYTRLNKE